MASCVEMPRFQVFPSSLKRMQQLLELVPAPNATRENVLKAVFNKTTNSPPASVSRHKTRKQKYIKCTI